jgi:hypothetical protein
MIFIYTIPSIGGTLTIPGASTDDYVFEGVNTMTNNFVVTYSAPVFMNRLLRIHWKADLDITTNNTHVFLLGHQLTQEMVNKESIFEFFWDGANWLMHYTPNFDSGASITPVSLEDRLNYRNVSVLVDYSNPYVQSLLMPFEKVEIKKVYMKEITPINGVASIWLDHQNGGLTYFIPFTNEINCTFNGVELEFNNGQTAGTQGVADCAYTWNVGDNSILIDPGAAPTTATSGLMEFTFIYKLL